MLDNDIMNLDATDLLNREWIQGVIDTRDARERERIKSLCLTRAKELKIYTQLNNTFREFETTARRIENLVKKEIAEAQREISLKCAGDGRILNTAENYLRILQEDKHFENIRYNLFKGVPETLEDGILRQWTDTDDSLARIYIESKYHIHSKDKLSDALRALFRERGYHPIKEQIEAVEWDKKERIPEMLIKWLHAEDTPYTREVSRLIFAGGINRIYQPGCKFDEVPILVGTKQGEGKGTFIRWLALDDKYYTELSCFDGAQGVEALQGAWMCEIAELLALTRAREVEAVKSYITRQNDKYREPYARTTTEHPRQCIFIGTSNKEQFLTDKTGNRRFYPVNIFADRGEIYSHEKEIKDEILQCWAEAKAKYDKGNLFPVVDFSVLHLAKEAQENALEDDYRVGMIAEYLESRQMVCGIELWQKALGNRDSKPNRKESNDIVLIMQGFEGWERLRSTYRSSEYGIQKGWRKKWEHI